MRQSVKAVHCVMGEDAHLCYRQLLLHALQLSSSHLQACEGFLPLHCCFSLRPSSAVSGGLHASEYNTLASAHMPCCRLGHGPDR